MYMVCKLDEFIDEATCWLYIYIFFYYICIYVYMSTLLTWVFIAWWYYVVLRAPMVDLCQRSHMGRIYFHSIEAIWEMIAREEWLGCRHDVAHVGHTRVNTSVGTIHIISEFSYYKTICIMFSNIYIYIA